MTREIKTNRYDPETGILTLTPYQAEAFQSLKIYYTGLFTDGNERMGIQSGIVKAPNDGHILTSFFSWLV